MFLGLVILSLYFGWIPLARGLSALVFEQDQSRSGNALMRGLLEQVIAHDDNHAENDSH